MHLNWPDSCYVIYVVWMPSSMRDQVKASLAVNAVKELYLSTVSSKNNKYFILETNKIIKSNKK